MKPKPSVSADFLDGTNLILEVPTVSGTHEFSVWDELGWGGMADDTQVLEEHAPKEVWWIARAAADAADAEAWVETVYDSYMAHLRRFAVYSLMGQGVKREKITQRDADDMRRRLYTEHATEEQRTFLLQVAFSGYIWEKYGGKDAKLAAEDLYKKDKVRYEEEYRFFRGDMLAYQETTDPVWIEEMIRRKVTMQKSVKLLEAMAAGFKSRGHLLRQAAENEKARKTAIGLSYEDVAAKVARILKDQQERTR